MFTNPWGFTVHSLHADLLGQELQLYVKLPWDYARSDAVYPVLYVLDANRAFPLYATMSLLYETPGLLHTQGVIVVGVAYAVSSERFRGLAQWAAWRTRDLTPVRREDVEHSWSERLGQLLGEEVVVVSGGAGRFLRTLREQVMPYVARRFRVSATDQGLAGFSYGGLFVLYTLFQAPGLFQRLFAGSPSLWEVLFAYEAAYATAFADLKAKLLLTAGAKETERQERMERLVARLRSRHYAGLDLQTAVFADEGHASSYAAAVSRALRVLYYEEGAGN